MVREEKYSIGEVSHMSGIPVATIRYYDKIDLLKPDIVNLQNNYRYYSKENVTSLLLIKYLRMLDFSIDEIRNVTGKGNLCILRQKVEQRILEIEGEIEVLQKKYKAAQDFKKFLQEGNQINRDGLICEKNYVAHNVISMRKKSPCDAKNFVERYAELVKTAETYQLHLTGEMYAKIYGRMYEIDNQNADLEVCLTVLEKESVCPYFKKENAYRGVSRIYTGAYETITEGYSGMLEYVEENEYAIPPYFILRYLINKVYTVKNEEYATVIVLPIL